MELLLIVMVLTVVVIAGATVIGPKVGLASPLLLVLVGILASLIPQVREFEIEPDVILQGILPVLLYSSAVSMPVTSFRRDFGPISTLSVQLVIATSLLLGLLFMWLLPDLGFAWGVALGAIISPTDAVATSIIKDSGVSRRVITILEGESLLNDATALVTLRTAIVSAAAGFSFWAGVGSFFWSVAVAIVLGVVVGAGNLMVRRRIGNSTVNTIVSFTVPFMASVPAELLGASGLVAAVVAGLVTGTRAPRELSPQHRLSDRQNWESVNVIGEGAVFLFMGLQMSSLLGEVRREDVSIWMLLAFALVALAAILLIRTAFVAMLLRSLRHKNRRKARYTDKAREISAKLKTPEGRKEAEYRIEEGNRRRHKGRLGRQYSTQESLARFATRLRRMVADSEYLTRQSMGPREGAIIVWSGMRGAVTLAAALTLPEDTPLRAVVIFLAFAVAAFSLLGQGSTIGGVVRRLQRPVEPGLGVQEAADREDAEKNEAEDDRMAVMKLLRRIAEDWKADHRADAAQDRRQAVRDRVELIRTQRNALLDARDDGIYDSEVLEEFLTTLDADQIAIEMRRPRAQEASPARER